LGPYKFDWIEFGRISGEPFHMEPWIAIEQIAHGLSPVDESFVVP
jgi:hypothetical protein